MKIREPDPVDDHRLPWLTIHLVVAGCQKTSNLALGPILVNQSGITTKEAGSQHQVAVSDFYKQKLLDLEAIKRKCDQVGKGV